MGQNWEDTLLEGSFDDVTFDFVSAREEHANDLDIQKFPGRPGQRVVGRANSGTRFEIMAVFIEDDYPEVMNDLIAKLKNGGVPKKFIHPIFGSFQASAERFAVHHDAEDRDSGTIQISFQEHTDGAAGPTKTTNSTPAKANKVRSLGTQVLQALGTFQENVDFITTNDYVVEVEGAVAAAQSTADSLEATGDQLSSTAISSMANSVISKTDDAIETLADYETTEQYDLSAALLAMAAALTELAELLIENRPPLQTFKVVADTNLLQWVFDRYGDPSRVAEVLGLNSFPDPMLIPAGFDVVAYAE
jgi:prophage DNA circulation protein